MYTNFKQIYRRLSNFASLERPYIYRGLCFASLENPFVHLLESVGGRESESVLGKRLSRSQSPSLANASTMFQSRPVLTIEA
jgi:hypothetical protein